MKKRIISLALTLCLLAGLLPCLTLGAAAASRVDAAPYASVEYAKNSGVKAGTVRYISQVPSYTDQSCADYWLRVFHADGLRMDAVSRLIYWQGDPNRGVNGSTLEFLKGMNAGLQQRHPTAILIAEDSTSFPKVTAPVEYGGLGFDYKWDLGWMNDTLDYFKKTPEERKSNLGKLTFSMMYFWREHYILPFSHDENVHGKATILQKMYGEYEDKFPQGRALYLYTVSYTHLTLPTKLEV